MVTAPQASKLRLCRSSEIGCAYLVTTVIQNREPVFADFNLARTLILTLRESDQRGATDTLCLVVMPDHLHWLFTLRASTLSAVVRAMKSAGAMQINRLRATQGQALWQRGFHDHGVREEDDLLALARYVVANPKRAGLVDSVAQYPHWYSAWL